LFTPERRLIGIVPRGRLAARVCQGRRFALALGGPTSWAGKPHSIGPDHLAVEAVQMMEQYKINQLPVVDEDGILLGALNMHDLFQAKVI